MKNIYDGVRRWFTLMAVVVSAVTMAGRAVAVPNDPAIAFSQVLLPTDPHGRGFGSGLATSGDTAIVGAPNEGTGDELNYGTASVFVYNGTTWVLQQELFATNGGVFLQLEFGRSVAMENNIAVIGASGDSIGALDYFGRAVVYAKVGGVWIEQQKLGPPTDEYPLDEFGNSVAINGGTIVVGAPLRGKPDTGAVYVFVPNGATWVQQAELFLPQSTLLGASVAIDGDTLMASANSNVVVYARTGTNWLLQQVIPIPNGGSSGGLGLPNNTVSLSGNTAVIGAPIGNAAYVYTRTGSTWTLSQQLVPAIGPVGDGYGYAVSIFGSRIYVGAPLGSDGVHIFENIGGTWTDIQSVTAPSIPNITASEFGDPIAVGPHGVLVGAPRTFEGSLIGAGAVYFFTNVPTQISITSASASPSVLWPPNHKWVPVTISVTTAGGAATCKIVSVNSNQPINGTGDGNTSPDWVITGDLTVLLRAERAGNIKTDRVYTITVECTDTFGNSARQNVFVNVPHDNGNK